MPLGLRCGTSVDSCLICRKEGVGAEDMAMEEGAEESEEVDVEGEFEGATLLLEQVVGPEVVGLLVGTGPIT